MPSYNRCSYAPASSEISDENPDAPPDYCTLRPNCHVAAVVITHAATVNTDLSAVLATRPVRSSSNAYRPRLNSTPVLAGLIAVMLALIGLLQYGVRTLPGQTWVISSANPATATAVPRLRARHVAKRAYGTDYASRPTPVVTPATTYGTNNAPRTSAQASKLSPTAKVATS
jgi:hypothetical protein